MGNLTPKGCPVTRLGRVCGSGWGFVACKFLIPVWHASHPGGGGGYKCLRTLCRAIILKLILLLAMEIDEIDSKINAQIAAPKSKEECQNGAIWRKRTSQQCFPACSSEHWGNSSAFLGGREGECAPPLVRQSTEGKAVPPPVHQSTGGTL